MASRRILFMVLKLNATILRSKEDVFFFFFMNQTLTWNSRIRIPGNVLKYLNIRKTRKKAKRISFNQIVCSGKYQINRSHFQMLKSL